MAADPHTTEELAVGQIFEGNKIIRELGRGGFGMVYLAFQQGMDRHVALKVLKSDVTLSAPSAKERFLREVRIISKLKHPNTVTIHDFGETYDGCLYMVLEYVEGETLKAVLKRDGAQDPLRSAELAKQIGRSLSEAHRHGVVHRDLKPANIMVTKIEGDKDYVKVLDFGVARLLDPKTNDLTSVGLPEGERELIGTPRYMSPEQVRGESLTGSSDIYSLGLMLYEMMAGEPAVQGDTTMGLITQQISPEPLRLPALPALPPQLQDICRIATSKPVTDRFQTAEQMAEALENVVFQLRRDANLTGPNSDMLGNLSTYSSQLNSMGGYQPGQSGWTPNPGSGQWGQPTPSGPYDPMGSGMYPNQQQGPGSGFYPHPHGTVPPGQMGPGVHNTIPPAQGHPTLPPQQVGSGNYAYPQQPVHQPQFQHQQPNFQQPNADYDAIELAPIDDFQATVERDAFSPDRSLGIPVDNLPPPPSDERPWNDPGSEPNHGNTLGGSNHNSNAYSSIPTQSEPLPRPGRSRGAGRVPGQEEEDLGAFAVGVAKICVFATLSGIGVYFSFLIVGGMMGEFLQGSGRFIGTIVLVLAIPGLTALGENSQKERFAVLEKGTDRVARIFIGITMFTLATCVLVSFAMPKPVINTLRQEPNWFMTEPDAPTGFAATNRNVSDTLSGMLVKTLGGMGFYDPRAGEVPKPHQRSLPKSTRDGNKQQKGGGKEELTDPKGPPKPKTGGEKFEEWGK